ncbi:MAG: alpha-glucosidase [Clostridia bacterium]|nr:alpha-glucosidase [Clostridia bacterium]
MENFVKTRWYKDSVVYQIYPRSFKDGNGDGIGDIRGIIEKLDYLKELGITAVWLSPCYKSPNADNGYDISDYRDIMDEFGTLDDWKEMTAGLHERGIKLIMDLVVNHTSDEHYWFQESRKSKDNPYRDYYIWRKGRGKNGKKPPNNWTSRFGGPAWKYDETTKEWYMHLWAEKQPDLNWDNPKVRKEVQDLVKYWLDLGVDGFRCDVITYISKTVLPDGTIPDGKFNPIAVGDEYFCHGPHIHEYLHELNEKVLSHYDSMTVGEAANVTLEEGLKYTAEDREELDTIFFFDHVESDMMMQVIPKKFDLRKLKAVFTKWQKGMFGKGWIALYYENHDQPRSLGRFTGKYGDHRKEAAKMLAVSLHMQQGTPYVYQGQELGMTNFKFKSVNEMRDQLATNIWNMIKYIPLVRRLFIPIMNRRSRDHGRMPMHWSADKYAGFSEVTPWYEPNPNYVDINVEESEKDPDSVLNFYKKLIALRKDPEVAHIIKNGVYTEYYPKNKDLYVYERSYKGETILIVCNFKHKNVEFKLPKEIAFNDAKLVISNYNDSLPLSSMTLRPYEAFVYKIS